MPFVTSSKEECPQFQGLCGLVPEGLLIQHLGVSFSMLAMLGPRRWTTERIVQRNGFEISLSPRGKVRISLWHYLNTKPSFWGVDINMHGPWRVSESTEGPVDELCTVDLVWYVGDS